MEGIQFVAKMGDWVAVKKLTVTEKTDPLAVLEFLASLGTGLDKKVEENLAKVIDLSDIHACLEEAMEGKKGAAAAAAALTALQSRALVRRIRAQVQKTGLDKARQKEVEAFALAYATRRALKTAGLAVDYAGVPVPGMKKLMKKKA